MSFISNVSNLLFCWPNYIGRWMKKKSGCALYVYAKLNMKIILVSKQFCPYNSNKNAQRNFNYNDVVYSTDLLIRIRMTNTREKNVRRTVERWNPFSVSVSGIQLKSLVLGLKVWSQLETNLCYLLVSLFCLVVFVTVDIGAHNEQNLNNLCDFWLFRCRNYTFWIIRQENCVSLNALWL